MVFLNKYLLSSKDVKVRLSGGYSSVHHLLLAGCSTFYHVVPMRGHRGYLCGVGKSEQKCVLLVEFPVI